MIFSCSSLAACDALNESDAPEEYGCEDDVVERAAIGTDDPSWLEDHEAAYCFKCDVKFSSSKRRHHCRRCRNIFCGKCTSHKSKILSYDVTKHVRVCSDCFLDLIDENRVIAETLPFLRGGDTFKMKAMMGLSTRIVTMRLMSDNSTLMYEDDSRREVVEMKLVDIKDIIPTTFDTFDIIAGGRTHSLQADSKQTQQAWVHGLRDAVNRALTPPLRTRVERLRSEKKEVMEERLHRDNVELNGSEEAGGSEGRQAAVREERKKAREAIRMKYIKGSASSP